jgi:hypothetical protein
MTTLTQLNENGLAVGSILQPLHMSVNSLVQSKGSHLDNYGRLELTQGASSLLGWTFTSESSQLKTC